MNNFYVQIRYNLNNMTDYMLTITFALAIITLILFSLDYNATGVCFLIITICSIKLNQLFSNKIQAEKKTVNEFFQ